MATEAVYLKKGIKGFHSMSSGSEDKTESGKR
jgi:hypothetical protein